MRELDTPLLQYMLQRGTTQLYRQPAVDLWSTPTQDYLDVQALGTSFVHQLLQQAEVTAALQETSSLLSEGKHLALGYPLLSLPDPHRVGQRICAPLLLWSLELVDQTHIRRTAVQSIRFNDTLAVYLRPDALSNEPPLPDLLLQDQLLDAKELLLVLQRALQYLAPQQLLPPLLEQDVQAPSVPLPTPDPTAKGLQLHWSGILADFPPQQGAVLRDLRALLHHFGTLQPLLAAPLNAADPDRSAFMKHSFPLFPTDPCQQELLQDLHQGKHLRVQVSPNTNGPATFSGIVANVLSNAGTCLVVSDEPATLQAIQKQLQVMGLGELVGYLQDSAQSRQALCQSIRQRATQQHPSYQVAPTFIQLLQTCAAQVGQLQAFAKKLAQPLQDQNNWTAVVGDLAQARAVLPQSALQGQLQPNRFQFNTTEYAAIQAILPQGYALFKELGSLQHPLNVLHDRFFERANSLEMEERTQTAVSKVLEVVQKAQRDAYTYLFEYEQLLEKHFGKVYTTKMSVAERIIDDIKIGLANSKYHFNKSEGLYRSFMKRMSHKHQEYEEQKIAILEAFYQLQRFHLLYRYFPFTFMDTSSSKKLVFTDLLEHIEDYKIQLYDWYEGRASHIQQLVRELGPNKIYPHVNFDTQVKDITRNLHSFERNFVDSQIFKVGFSFQSSAIRKRLTQIEALEQNLTDLQTALCDFRMYHALKYFWLSITPLQRHVLEILTTTNCQDWSASFATWYLDALLRRHEDEQVPNTQRHQQASETLLREQTVLRQRLIPHTLSYWRGKQTQATQAFHQAQAPLTVGALYASNGQRSLRTLMATDTELFFSFYPVVLAAPAAVAALLPLQVRCMNLGLLLDAHQLAVDVGLPTLLRTQYHLVAGDQQQEMARPLDSALSVVTTGLSAAALPLAKAHSLLTYVRWLPRFQAQQLRLEQRVTEDPASWHLLPLDPSIRPKVLELHLQAVAQAAFPQLSLVVGYSWQGMPTDLAIPSPAGPPKAVCYVDTYSEGSPEGAYAWDLFLEQYWVKLGVAYHRVWSKDWWQSPEQAADQWRHWLAEQATY